MTIAEEIVRIARAEVGITEASGTPSERYFYGLRDARRVPWCAAFALWVIARAGFEGLPGKGAQMALHSVDACERWMEESGLWHRGPPRPGDLIFYPGRGRSDPGRGRHMGIVVEIPDQRHEEAPSYVMTVEGNVSNAVKLLRRDLHGHPMAPTGFARLSGRHEP